VFQRSEGGTPNAKDAFFSVAGVGSTSTPAPRRRFINDFKQTIPGKSVDPYAILGAQAARVLLDAIANSDGTRQGIIDEVFKTKISDGLIAASRSTRTATSPVRRVPPSSSRSTRALTSS